MGGGVILVGVEFVFVSGEAQVLNFFTESNASTGMGVLR
jgi:hypothetical protein